ncbi:hypothetical protein [Planotetraspora sp. GP83]|uniref:hypothetical protein n=1 Tax=Planotetraspora sp. GP83 TaxID=3156264 RepID=UPI003519A179
MFGVNGMLFALTEQFQLVLGYSTLKAGAALLPVAAAVMTGSLLCAVPAKALGVRTVVASGLVLVGVSLGVMAVYGPTGGYLPIAVTLVAFGIGMSPSARWPRCSCSLPGSPPMTGPSGIPPSLSPTRKEPDARTLRRTLPVPRRAV